MKAVALFPRLRSDRFVYSENILSGRIILVSKENNMYYAILTSEYFEVIKSINGMTNLEEIYRRAKSVGISLNIDDFSNYISSLPFVSMHEIPRDLEGEFTKCANYKYSKRVGPFSPCITPISFIDYSNNNSETEIKYAISGLNTGL